MNTHSKPESEIKGFSLLIENWRFAGKPETRAGRYVISRFPVPPAHADLIANLAGIGSDDA